MHPMGLNHDRECPCSQHVWCRWLFAVAAAARVNMFRRGDPQVPWEHGKGIYEAVPEAFRRRPWWVPDRGHNDVCEGRRHLRCVSARQAGRPLPRRCRRTVAVYSAHSDAPANGLGVGVFGLAGARQQGWYCFGGSL